MKRTLCALALLSGSTLTASCTAQTQGSTPLPFGTLIQTDFEDGVGWGKLMPKAVGTVDVAGSTQSSLGLVSNSTISSGALALQNTESNLGKLTLAFNLSASAARPVKVTVESFDKNKKRTGGLETLIYPAAPDFYQRYALDLSSFKAVGKGKFNPTAPFVGFNFATGGDDWKGIEKSEIRLDNVEFAKPAWYVSVSGNDHNDGRSEKTAFATPQKAVDMTGPGDIVVVMDGTYLSQGVQAGIIHFAKTGTAKGWISIKNYPGQHPLFSLIASWGAIRWQRTKEQAAEQAAAGLVIAPPSYIEVRGMHIRGEGDVAATKYPTKLGQSEPETNSNGISVAWVLNPNEVFPHHLRFADNIVEFCSGGGIGPGSADWVSIENNTVRNNCWTTIYATSGISFNGGVNFDGTVGGTRDLIRNNVVSGNRTYQPWYAVKRISDGNGIIIDINQDNKVPVEKRYSGRTLIQNNLVFNNGGSGIHTLSSKRIDIINNTAYLNAASPELRWGQIFLQHSDDANIVNNILVARDDSPVNTVGLHMDDTQNTHVHRAGNLYFGGIGPIMGDNDVVGDPLFVHPDTDATTADFGLKPGSPALNSGLWEPLVPVTDINGKPRPLDRAPSKGAIQN